MKASDLLALLNENANWVENSIADLQLEYKVEYKNHTIHSMGDIWPTFEDFQQAYILGKTISVDWAAVGKIARATTYKSPEALLDMIKGYRSYPEFCNEQTFQAIIDGIESGAEMKLPIVLNSNGRLIMFSGNTRTNLSLILTGEAKVKVVDV